MVNVGDYKMPFGMYKGKTLVEISGSKRGLMYLDWLMGEFDDGPIKTQVTKFMSDPQLQKELDEARAEKEAREGTP